MAACVERRAACGASYNAYASGATPCKFETRQPARPAEKARADRQFQRRVSRTDAPQSSRIRFWPNRNVRTGDRSDYTLSRIRVTQPMHENRLKCDLLSENRTISDNHASL